jgi:transposase
MGGVLLDKVGGVDVHRDTLTATVLGDDVKETRKFGVDFESLSALKSWMKRYGVGRVAMESTGICWVPIYTCLEDEFNVLMANARQVKAMPGRKTDQKDSEWLAQLLGTDLIKPSYVPERKMRELRSLCRLRVKFSQTRTDFKNRVHKILQVTNVRIASVLSDIFGKNGLIILHGLMEGRSVDEILKDLTDKRIKRKRSRIVQSIMGALSRNGLFELQVCLDELRSLDEKIVRLDERITSLLDSDAVERLDAIPAVDKVTASVAIAEIADPKRFLNEKQLTSSAGIAPSVYQSGGKARSGHITKQGSRWLRRVPTQAAFGAVKARNSRFRLYYLRVRSRRGSQVAMAVALWTLSSTWRNSGFICTKPTGNFDAPKPL